MFYHQYRTSLISWLAMVSAIRPLEKFSSDKYQMKNLLFNFIHMLLQKSIMPTTKPSFNDGSWVKHGLGIEVSLSNKSTRPYLTILTNFIGFPSVLECQTKNAALYPCIQFSNWSINHSLIFSDIAFIFFYFLFIESLW